METRYVSGRVTPGIYDDGYLMYTHDGHVSAVLTMEHRLRFATDNLTGGSAEEKGRAVETYLSYGGRYSVEGDIITHHVLFSLFPNWVGSDQVRRFALDPETGVLTIRTVYPILFQDEETYSYLTWRRA